jgi:hypothetical protein
MNTIDPTLSVGAQVAHDFSEGVHQRIEVDGVIYNAAMDVRTGLLDQGSHLAIENAIKSSFQEGIVPQVTRTTVHGEAEV